VKVLVIAEHDNRMLLPQVRSVLGAARQIAPTVDVMVIGYDCAGVVEEAALLEGVALVRALEGAHYRDFPAENLAMVIAQLAGGYTHVVLPATAFGKNLGPRVAAMLDVAQVSEIIEVVDSETFVRPIYAGNLLETVRSIDPVKVLTIRASAFPGVENGGVAAPVQMVSPGPDMGVSRMVRREPTMTDRPQLSTARVVVAGGRGFGSPEKFNELLEPLADCLGAAIGATRAAVDGNFVGNDSQIGQTGKTVAPDVYIAIGISGAMQHLAGMRGSKLIIAINKDPDAPIFRVADIGLVGDLNEILPQLTAALR
jgi:electron transfer flavoprotein alpha subunit